MSVTCVTHEGTTLALELVQQLYMMLPFSVMTVPSTSHLYQPQTEPEATAGTVVKYQGHGGK